MADWTDTISAPFGCSYWNSYAGIHSISAATGTLGGQGSAAYPGANRAIYIPFRLMNPIRVTQLWQYNGFTASGNFDLGIYDAVGTKLVSLGSTAQSGTSQLQIVALGTPVRLGVGLFYMAVAFDGTTGTLLRTSLSILFCKIVGMAQQAAAFPLPATATFATITSAYIPVIGFISEEG